MNLLLDENISWRIKSNLSKFVDKVIHVHDISNERLTDIEIWNYAKANSLIILTYDADFSDILNYKGFPPKIIWLRRGNMSKNQVEALIKDSMIKINIFEKSKELGILEIY